MNIEIVDAESSDIYENWEIQKACWLDNFVNAEKGISREDILAWFDENTEDNKKKLSKRAEKVNKNIDEHLWEAKDEEKVVGFAAAKRGERNEIEAMFILPEYQGQGIGGKLMKRALKWIGNQEKIYLNVVAYNNNAIGFYKKFGFVETNKKVDSGVEFSSGTTLPSMEMVKRKF